VKKTFRITVSIILAVLMISTMALAKQPVRENRLKTFDGPFAFGRSFNEIGLTAGGYYADENELKGGYFIAEANHWNEQKDAGRNWSFLGTFIMFEPGEVQSGYEWRKLKLMYQPGIYEILDEHETYHLLIKPRVGVSINFGTEKETNPAYGVYSEFDKIFDPHNRAGFIFDAMIEHRDIGEDGQVNPRLFFEEGFGEEGKTVMLSAGPIWHVTPNETTTGVAGAISLRVPINSDVAWQIALTGDVTKDSKTVGAFVSLTWDDIMHVFQQKGR
jgi:hypothetical protein